MIILALIAVVFTFYIFWSVVAGLFLLVVGKNTAHEIKDIKKNGFKKDLNK